MHNMQPSSTDVGGSAAPHDPVNNPQHYRGKTIQVIDVIESWGAGYHAGNAIKYMLRGRHKNGVEDLRKCIWYLDRARAPEIGAISFKRDGFKSNVIRDEFEPSDWIVSAYSDLCVAMMLQNNPMARAAWLDNAITAVRQEILAVQDIGSGEPGQ